MVLLQLGLLLLVPFVFVFFCWSLSWIRNSSLGTADLTEESPLRFVPLLAIHGFIRPFWTQQLVEGFISLRFELGKFRALVFFICSRVLGYIFALLIPTLFTSVNPIWLLGVALMFYVGSFFWRKLFKASVLAFGLSLMIFSFEMVTRNFAGLNMLLTESNMIWILTDGRWMGCLLLFFVSLMLTVFLRIPYFGFLAGVIFLFLQMISLNGFIFVIAGDLLGGLIIVFCKLRHIRGKLAQLKNQWFLVSVFGLIAGTIVAAMLRQLGIGDLNSFAESVGRYEDSLIVFVCLPLGILFSNLIWGHFSYPGFSKDFEGSGTVQISVWDRLIFAGPWAGLLTSLENQSVRWDKAQDSSRDLDPAMIPVRLRERLSQGLKDLKIQVESVRTFLQA